MLVVIRLQVWRVYLLGTPFVIKTNNVANTYFATQKKLSRDRINGKNFFKSTTSSGNTSPYDITRLPKLSAESKWNI